MRILIVDDSPMIHKMLKKALESHGHRVCGVGKNGKEGVELYKELKPDLVFMDVTMPILDGLGALKEIKRQNSAAKVVMLTAMGDNEIVAEAKELGCFAFLKKPFNDFKIVSVLSRL